MNAQAQWSTYNPSCVGLNVANGSRNIGIGTTLAGAKLHVQGSTFLNGNTTINGDLMYKGVKLETALPNSLALQSLTLTGNIINFTGAALEFYTPIQAQYNGNKPVFSMSQFGELNFFSSPFLNYNHLLLKGAGDYKNGLSFADSFGTTAGIGGAVLFGENGGALGSRLGIGANEKVALSWDKDNNVKLNGKLTFADGSVQTTAGSSWNINNNYLTYPQNVNVLGSLKLGQNSLFLGSTSTGTAGTLNYIYADNASLEIQNQSAVFQSTILNKNGGNVGIGLNNPVSKLDVNGDIKTSGNITIGGFLNTNQGVKIDLNKVSEVLVNYDKNLIVTGPAPQALYVTTSQISSTDYTYYSCLPGQTPPCRFPAPILSTISGTINKTENTLSENIIGQIINPQVSVSTNSLTQIIQMPILRMTNVSNTGQYSYQTIGSTLVPVVTNTTTNNTGRTKVLANLIGIGIQNPTESLEVLGNAKITANITVAGIKVGNGPLITNLQSSPWKTNATNDVSYLDGKIGIGTANPKFILDVNSLGSGWVQNIQGNVYGVAPNNNFVGIKINNGVFQEPFTKWVGIASAIETDVFHPDGYSALALYAGEAERVRITSDGKMNIGPQPATNDYKLSVDGKIIAKELKLNIGYWPDDVFETNYKLISISNLEKFILQNKHLPDVPTATELKKNGVNTTEMLQIQMKKIEELTLMLIQQNKEIEILKNKVYSKN